MEEGHGEREMLDFWQPGSRGKIRPDTKMYPSKTHSSNVEGLSGGGTSISLGRGSRIDFAGRLGTGRGGNRRAQWGQVRYGEK